MPLFNPTVSEVTATIPILSSGGVAPDISIPQSDAITDGYLSSVDWVIFDAKGNGTVTGVSGTLPITSSGGATPVISTSIATNRLVGRGTAGVGVFEEIILGTNLSFTGTTLNATGGGGGGVASVTGTLPILSSGGANPDISIPQSGAITDGYLSSVDWNIFDAKGNSNFGGVTSTAPVSTDNTDPNNPILSMGQSGAVTDGYLTSVDWVMFDSKGSSNFGGVTSTAPVSTDNTDPNNPILSMGQSGAITDGYLSSIDWNIFNSKGNGTVTNVTATSLITSSGGTTPDISTSMATNRLLGRGTAGVGVFEEIILGTNLSFTGTTLNASGGGGGTVTGVTATLPISSSGGATPDISITQSSGATDGYLSFIDWNIFNNKGNGTVTNVSALTLGTTGTDLSSSVATSTTTPVITLNVPTASALNRGALSSADWTTFNNKGSGTVTGVTATSLITSSGGVAPNISTSMATNRLLGRGTALSGVFEEIILGTNLSLTGTTLNASGGGTVTSVSGTLNRIDSTGGATPVIDISATYVGQTSITTLGTIGTGVWDGTTIAILNGGTGQTTATLAFDALSPTTTRGDTIVRGVTNNVRLALGTVGRILRSDGTDLVYTTATYPTTTTVSTLLYSSAANVISALATANSGILVTSATGVPSISAQLTYVTSTGILTNTLSINGNSRIIVTNANVGVSTACDIVANNGTSAISITQRGTAFTTTGLVVANQGMLASSASSSMLINTTVASVPIIFAVGGTAATNEVHRSTSSGIEFRVLLKSLVHSAANLMAGQITLIGGTLAVTITGLTTSHRGMVTLVTANNVLNTRSYQAVCTVNTITIRANTDTGLLNIADTSVLNYFIFLNN